MNEGLGVPLDPSFRLTSAMLPYAQRQPLRQYSPRFWTKRIGQAGLDAAWPTTELPLQVLQLLGELERGNLKLAMQMTDYANIMRKVVSPETTHRQKETGK